MALKTILLMVVTLALSTGTALAQHPGFIGIFSDSIGYDCDLWDTAPGPCVYHVVHVNTGGAVGSMFAAPQPECFQSTYLNDTPVFPVTVGDSQKGISIAYGACLSGTFHILDIRFFCVGLTQQCCMYRVVGDPSRYFSDPEVTDCDLNTRMAWGWTSPINPDGYCCCYCGPTEESTWGRVKSLYRE
jgi:hypothetical protein